MGDWTLRRDPATGEEVWSHDPAAPSPGHNPAVTMIQPVVARELDALHGDEDDHAGQPVDPDELPSYDQVESKLIRPLGAPE